MSDSVLAFTVADCDPKARESDPTDSLISLKHAPTTLELEPYMLEGSCINELDSSSASIYAIFSADCLNMTSSAPSQAPVRIYAWEQLIFGSDSMDPTDALPLNGEIQIQTQSDRCSLESNEDAPFKLGQRL